MHGKRRTRSPRVCLEAPTIPEGGMIGYFLAENKIRFEANLHSAQKTKLNTSSGLLALAMNVIGRQRGA